jgi:hypothetical protein
MALSIGGKDESGGYGYKNPLSNNMPSWGGSNDSVDWKGGFEIDKSGLWDKSFGRYNNPAESYLNLTKNKLFDTARQKRDNQDSSWSPSGWSQGGGGGVAASGGEILPGFGWHESGKLPPLVIHAPQKSGGLGGAIGTLAGIGASFIPGLGPGIAAAMPAIGGNIGGMFG